MANNNTSDLIDIKSILTQYASKWYLFAISIVVCLCIGVAFIKFKKPVYGVRANVLIQVDEANPLSSMGSFGDLLGSSGQVDDEIYVISSHSLLRDVARQLGVNQSHRVRHGFLNTVFEYPNAPLKVVTTPELPDTLGLTITFKVKVSEDGRADIKAKAKHKTIAEVENAQFPINLHTIYGDFTIEKTDNFLNGKPFTDKITFRGYHATAESLSEDVSTNLASKKSNAIELSINTTNPEYGMAVLNEMIAKYNQRGILEKNLQGKKTAEFIEERLAILNEGLTDAEMQIQNYKESHNIIDVTAEASYQTTKKGQLESALLSAETQSEIIKMTGDFLRNPENAYALAPATANLTGNQSGKDEGIAAYNALVLQRMELMQSARDNNIGLTQLTKQIDMMRENLLTTIDKAYESSLITVKDLRAEKASADSRLGQVPLQEREFLTMKRQQAVKQSLYTYLLQRNEETAMLIANAVPKGLIVDEAYTLNEPLGLSSLAILAIALMFGICLPPFYIQTRRLILNRFESREEAERVIDVPILGELCLSKSPERLVATRTSTSSATELFRLLRTNLLFILNDKSDKVVLVTSARSGEGKSFVSLNMASTFALLENKKVLLVGMDIRKPELANYLGIPATPGLTQYLAGQEPDFHNIIQRNKLGNGLDVIVAGPIPPNPAELLASEKVDNLFNSLREMYDYIIIDSAPVGMVSDSFALNRVADASVIVSRVNYTTLTDVKFINTIGEQKRLKKMSVIINGTKSKQGYGYGYGN